MLRDDVIIINRFKYVGCSTAIFCDYNIIRETSCSKFSLELTKGQILDPLINGTSSQNKLAITYGFAW